MTVRRPIVGKFIELPQAEVDLQLLWPNLLFGPNEPNTATCVYSVCASAPTK